MSKVIHVNFENKTVTRVDEFQPNPNGKQKVWSKTRYEQGLNSQLEQMFGDADYSHVDRSRESYLRRFKNKINNRELSVEEEKSQIEFVKRSVSLIDSGLTKKGFFNIGALQNDNKAQEAIDICIGLMWVREKLEDMEDTIRVMLLEEAGIEISDNRSDQHTMIYNDDDGDGNDIG